ncbi:restriction endonuclease, SacI family [bacterium]|nr:restriction endonuclease, SacI family [bacterium]
MPQPEQILDSAFQRASRQITRSILRNAEIATKVNFVCRNLQNRACVRLLLACSLAKTHNPNVDIRKPYTEIGDEDTYSGRTYDESYISQFIIEHDLPCNPTTGFLTPALRNRNIVLTPDINLVGRPPQLYQTILELLSYVHTRKVSARNLLAETVRCLLIVRDERRQRMNTLLAALRASEGAIPLSSEGTVSLIQQHISCPRASRLPVLAVAAAYKAAADHLRERILPLSAHTSADEQTGALGDLHITLVDDNNVVTCYEMKTRRVTREDINRALQKISQASARIDNCIFITTDPIDQEAQDYATSIYDQSGGIEITILDCLGFLRHFLHLFHRLRTQYLDAYQELLLADSESSVSQPLKEAFLSLRHAAESCE